MANHIPVHKEVLLNPDLSLAEKGLYALLCCYAGDNGSCPPYGRREFAAILDISPSTMGVYAERLIELGYISVSKERRNGQTGHKCCRHTVNQLKEVDR